MESTTTTPFCERCGRLRNRATGRCVCDDDSSLMPEPVRQQVEAEDAVRARRVVSFDGRRPDELPAPRPQVIVEPPSRPELPRELPDWAPKVGRVLTVVVCVLIVGVGAWIVKGILFPPAQPGDDLPEPARTALRIACPVWASAPIDQGAALGGTAIAIRPHFEQASAIERFAGLPADADTVASLALRIGEPDLPLAEAAEFSQAVGRIDAACDLVGA